MSVISKLATIRPPELTSAASSAVDNCPANSPVTGKASGMVQAYSLPRCSITDSSSTRS